MQEGNKSLGMLRMCNLDCKIFNLSPVAYITGDFNPIKTGVFSECVSLEEGCFHSLGLFCF